MPGGARRRREPRAAPATTSHASVVGHRAGAQIMPGARRPVASQTRARGGPSSCAGAAWRRTDPPGDRRVPVAFFGKPPGACLRSVDERLRLLNRSTEPVTATGARASAGTAPTGRVTDDGFPMTATATYPHLRDRRALRYWVHPVRQPPAGASADTPPVSPWRHDAKTSWQPGPGRTAPGACNRRTGSGMAGGQSPHKAEPDPTCTVTAHRRSPMRPGGCTAPGSAAPTRHARHRPPHAGTRARCDGHARSARRQGDT